MKPLALAIDDDQLLLANVARRLDLIGHAVQTAGSVEEARISLRCGTAFDYVLLDLELPIANGQLPDKQHGLNLLGHINDVDQHLPVVVMTAHDHDSSDLSAEVMRHGRAVDYLRKPFPTPPSRHQTLESAVRQAYQRRREHHQKAQPQTRPFPGGQLDFHPDRVEFHGVVLCGDEDSGMMRRILDLLYRHRGGNQWLWMTGSDLADKVGAAEAGSVASAIAAFRKRVCLLLLEQGRIACPADGIIRSSRSGYALGTQITPAGVTASPEPCEDSPIDGDGLTGRQRQILDRLRAGERLRNRSMQEDFGISERTVKRDMGELRSRGLARYDGAGNQGAWVLVTPAP